MTFSKAWFAAIAALIIALLGYFAYMQMSSDSITAAPIDPTPQEMTVTGTYTCLPHADTTGPQTDECAFGLKADDGTYYAVNFGQSADAMAQFRSGAHVTLDGFFVRKEALSTDHWDKYQMEGIFTVTSRPDVAPAQGKLNMKVVCESALAYMSFPDGASADAFVEACIRGEHPEVLQQYKAQMGLGDGAAI